MHFPDKAGLKSQPLKWNILYYGLRITNSAARSLPNSSCPNRWGVRFTVCSDPPPPRGWPISGTSDTRWLTAVPKLAYWQLHYWGLSFLAGRILIQTWPLWPLDRMFAHRTDADTDARLHRHAHLEDKYFMTLRNGVLSVTVPSFKKRYSCKVRRVSGKTSQ